MAPGNPVSFTQKKDHDLTADEIQRIRDRIERGDADVYKLAEEFHCAPIQIAGIKAVIRKDRGPKTIPTTPSGNTKEFVDPCELLNHLVSSSKVRAREMGVDFSLTPEFVADLYERQAGMCAVTRRKFNMKRFPDALVKHPFAPSIDRIDSKLGYTTDNVRLVCVAVNFGMGEWGTEVYLNLARTGALRQIQTSQNRRPSPIRRR